MRKTFATIPEIAALSLPSVPTRVPLQARSLKENWKRPEWEGVYWWPRMGAGGGVEYSYKLLPKIAQLAWVQRFLDCTDQQSEEAGDHSLAWERYHEASASQKAKALETLRIVEMIEQLQQASWSFNEALTAYNTEQCATVGRTTVMGWKRTIRTVPREHWLAYLVPKRKGPKASHAQCSEEAWDFIKADWLRPEKPTVSACYRRLQQAAEEHGWTFPSEKTLARWLHALPIEVVMFPVRVAKRARQIKQRQKLKNSHANTGQKRLQHSLAF